MKRLWAIFLISAFISSNLLIPASAAVKAGSPCKMSGQSVVDSGKRYTCIKNGKKLVWSKGVVVTQKKPATVLPNPAPSPSVIPIAPTSFENLQSRLDGVIYGAWFKASEKMKVSVTSLGTTKFLVGPNTKEDDPNSLASLNLASRLFGSFPQVKNLVIIKYSSNDIAWAQQQYDLVRPRNYNPNVAKDFCSGRNGCDGASAGITSDGVGVLFLGQGGSYVGQPLIAGGTRAQNGLTMAHEYIHTIQTINAPCIGGRPCYGDVPVWLLEGSATWSAAAARFSANFNDFLTERNSALVNQYSKASSLYTAEYVSTFLNPNPDFSNNQGWSYWEKYDRWDNYAIGLLVSEILVNIKNTDSLMKLYSDVGSGKSFVDSFQQEFGLPWSEACPKIAEAIAGILKQGIKK
jgi:hypothetical protein